MSVKKTSSYVVFTIVLLGLVYLGSCLYHAQIKPEESVQIALDWNRFILDAELNTEGYRGPVAARTYGYVGLAAYESVVPAMAGYKSFSGVLGELKLPKAPHLDSFNLAVALNSSYATILQHFFMSSPETIKNKLRDLRAKWDYELKSGLDSTTYLRSVNYGDAIAEAVFAWSATDSLGYNANHHNYDRNYKPPVGPGKWVPSKHIPMPPLLPYWGGVRPFIIEPEKFMAKDLPPYSAEPSSFYHTQAMEVLTLSKPLSLENKWVSDFWNDDRPGLTFSPAGRWLAITNQVIAKEMPTIEKTLETYLRIGFALSDAMVACWKSKYTYNVERPESFIQNNIAPDWRPYSPTPSFPSYPSGHSILGAAAANVLTSLYGENYKIEDRSHEGLRDFKTEPRKFGSFKEMSEENALSRILMGVHYRMDCEEGLRLGDLIGNEIMKVRLEEKLTQ